MKTLVHFFFVILFFLATTATGQKIMTDKAELSHEAIARYDAFLQKQIDAKKLPGAVSLIYRNGEVGHFKSLGYSEMDTQKPMSNDQIFYIQSMTKPIISIAFMMLFEEGHFFLDEPVSNYIPAMADLKVIKVKEAEEGAEPMISFDPLDGPIKMWHLLSHTAGFSHGLGQNEYDKKLWKLLYEGPHVTIEDRVNALLSYPLMGQPGKQWNYSASPDVLALLIEKISGQTCAEFLQERIFDPLGMDDTGYNVADDAVDRVAGLHQMNEDGTLSSTPAWGGPQGNTIYGGTHGLYSTAEDYLKFSRMLLNGGSYDGHRYVGKKTLELMTQNHIEGLPYSPGYGFGLGFGIRTDLSDSAMPGSEGAFFWGGAFNTAFLVDPKEDMVAVFMSQYWPSQRYFSQKMRQFVYSTLD